MEEEEVQSRNVQCRYGSGHNSPKRIFLFASLYFAIVDGDTRLGCVRESAIGKKENIGNDDVAWCSMIAQRRAMGQWRIRATRFRRVASLRFRIFSGDRSRLSYLYAVAQNVFLICSTNTLAIALRLFRKKYCFIGHGTEARKDAKVTK